MSKMEKALGGLPLVADEAAAHLKLSKCILVAGPKSLLKLLGNCNTLEQGEIDQNVVTEQQYMRDG